MNRRDFLLSTSSLLLAPLAIRAQEQPKPVSSVIVFADFESGTYDGWTLTGNCWTATPPSEATYPGIITGFQGKYYMGTYHPKLGVAATGKAVSKEFTIEKAYINFLIGGGNYPGEACVSLVVDGKAVRTETGNDSRQLFLRFWDVRQFAGRTAHLQIVDNSTSIDRGYVMVDDIRFSNSRPISQIDAAYDRVDFNDQYDQNSMDRRFQTALQQTVQSIADHYHAVGATVLCVVGGKLLAAVAVGERKIGSGIPIRVPDPMHIGSNTKGMTALLFARLVEAGKLNWNQTLEQTFKTAVSDDLNSVPLIELLRQRSGITDGTSPNLFDNKYLSLSTNSYLYSKGIPAITARRAARQLFVADAIRESAGYPPLSKFQYCNTNYVIAGAAEELAAAQPWEDLMHTEVFAPLHMRAAGFGPMGTGQQDDVSAPWQHVKQDDGSYKPIYYDNPLYFGPAGVVHCSALDLANYAYAHLVGSLGHGSYLTPKTWNILHTPPQGGGYACGVAVSGPDGNGIRDMSHGGSNNMSCSDWWVREHGRIIIVSMINCQSPEGNKAILDDVLALTKS